VMTAWPRRRPTVTALLALASVTWVLGGGPAAAAARAPRSVASSSWTVYHGDAGGRGVAGPAAAVNTTTRAWTSPVLDGEIYGEPLVSSGRVYVATEDDTVYELSAATGAVVWATHLGSPVPSTDLPCGDITPTVGITGTPVIDQSRGEIFVVADELVNGKPAHMFAGLATASGKLEVTRDVDPAGVDTAALLQRTGLTLDDGLAEDVTAETFLAAFGCRGRYDGAWSDARPWLYGIAVRQIRRHRRVEARRLRLLRSALADGPAEDHSDRVAERVTAERLGPRLAAVVAALPRQDRELLLLFAWAGLSYAEAATALGTTTSAVKARLHPPGRVHHPSGRDAAGIGAVPGVPDRCAAERRQYGRCCLETRRAEQRHGARVRAGHQACAALRARGGVAASVGRVRGLSSTSARPRTRSISRTRWSWDGASGRTVTAVRRRREGRPPRSRAGSGHAVLGSPHAGPARHRRRRSAHRVSACGRSPGLPWPRRCR
jgi:RNA polymerase sigma factor (sigma-70 family)